MRRDGGSPGCAFRACAARLARCAAAVTAAQAWLCWGSCDHEYDVAIEQPDPNSGDVVSGNHTVLQDGAAVTHSLGLNRTRLYYYENYNATTMNLPEGHRKLIISLETCEGIVYLFVRRTRRCWPNPYACCNPLPGSPGEGDGPTTPPCDTAAYEINCPWTHFHSVIDGTRDAAPSFFELPLTSTKYYISVFAPRQANLDQGVVHTRYRLLALADTGAYPRPGMQGQIRSKQVDKRSIELSWEQANFVPMGVSDIRRYHVFSSLLLPHEKKSNEAVFLSPSKVMNSVCGLERNAVRYGSPLTNANCHSGVCVATISGIVPRRRYMINIVSESQRDHNSSYSGTIVSMDWSEQTQVFTDSVVGLIGAICGTVFGVLVIGYLWIVKLYN